MPWWMMLILIGGFLVIVAGFFVIMFAQLAAKGKNGRNVTANAPARSNRATTGGGGRSKGKRKQRKSR